MDPEFRRAIEEIKLRAPIEEVVRERVPELQRRGATWTACCPFHEERTPSFVVTPARGTWHCFGACSEGGDQISFLERFHGIGFLEAVEMLARATGVELPERRRDAGERGRRDAELEVLQRAEAFFARKLFGEEGRAAREYLVGRGLTEDTLRAFGLGWAPAAGTALVDRARERGVPLELLERTGLARRNDRGGAYDFFRGRLVIPIRDARGRTVGFGARRLEGDERGGPKYVNTPETRLFHKGRLVYGLDLATEEVRRSRHLVLVEGYTDVMAAHQVGLRQVAAVLGTATTAEHAGLIRRTGARRVSLVFDGDEAGRTAAYRALAGLLRLEVELDVVELPPGRDPCDVLLAEGADAFRQRLEKARGWWEFVCAGLRGLEPRELSTAVDRVLALLAELPRPVEREAHLERLAGLLAMPVAALREQASRGGARRGPVRAPAPPQRRDPVGGPAGPARAGVPGAGEGDPRPRRAWAGILGAILLDPSLVPLVREREEDCGDPELKRILEVVLELYEDEDAPIDAQAVLSALGEDPARRRVVPLVEHAARAESPRALLLGELDCLSRVERERRRRALLARVAELERAAARADGERAAELSRELNELLEHEKELLASRPGGGEDEAP